MMAGRLDLSLAAARKLHVSLHRRPRLSRGTIVLPAARVRVRGDCSTMRRSEPHRLKAAASRSSSQVRIYLNRSTR